MEEVELRGYKNLSELVQLASKIEHHQKRRQSAATSVRMNQGRQWPQKSTWPPKDMKDEKPTFRANRFEMAKDFKPDKGRIVEAERKPVQDKKDVTCFKC